MFSVSSLSLPAAEEGVAESLPLQRKSNSNSVLAVGRAVFFFFFLKLFLKRLRKKPFSGVTIEGSFTGLTLGLWKILLL